MIVRISYVKKLRGLNMIARISYVKILRGLILAIMFRPQSILT
jgi:hypothetical protein